MVSSPIQHELLLNRLHGLCREWTDFCDQETIFEIGSDNRTDTNNLIGMNRSSGNTSAAVGVLAATASGSATVTIRVRRSLLSRVNKPGREFSVLRYLGAVETDKIVSLYISVKISTMQLNIGFWVVLKLNYITYLLLR